MQKIVINMIKANIPSFANRSDADIKASAIQAVHTAPTTEYMQAANAYLDKSLAPIGETPANNAIRENERNIAKLVIDQKLKEENSAINKYLASYRALERIKDSQEGLYTEKVMGRFNVPEILAYAVEVALDVKEQKYIAVNNNLPATNQDIFKRQKDNLDNLLTTLGDSQRAYNRNQYRNTNDPRNGIVDNHRKGGDQISCAHGVCVRIVDSMIGKHREVSVSDQSPATFAHEFQQSIKKQVRGLPIDQQNVIKDFHDKITNIDITVNNQQEAVFKDNGIDFPVPYQQVLSNVTRDLNLRYNCLNPNKRLQLIGKDDAVRIFQQLEYLDFNN